ncbi:MAG: tetratricopeptide repeat protein [Candidatus Margulisiibacteriota bacterium]
MKQAKQANNKNQSKLSQSDRFQFSFDLALEIGILILLFLIPIVFDRRIGIVFSGTKVTWLRNLVIILMSLWGIKLLVTGRHRLVRTPLDWPVLTFLLTTTVAAITSVHVFTSIAGFYGRFEGLSTWYAYGLLFFLVTNYIRSIDQVKRLIVMTIPAATIQAIYGIIARAGVDPYAWGGVPTVMRVIGLIGQPNFFAAYVIMTFFLTIALFLEDQPESSDRTNWLPLAAFVFINAIFVFLIYNLGAYDVPQWIIGFSLMIGAALYFAFTYQRLPLIIWEAILVVSLLLMYMALLYTQSRGGYMGFFTGAVLFALCAGRHRIFNNFKKLSFLLLLIVAITGIIAFDPAFSPFQRFTSEVSIKTDLGVEDKGIDQQETSAKLELKGAAGSRGETWKSAAKIIVDYPLFGIGPEVLKMVFPRYETEMFRFLEAFHVKQDRCHNETFDVPVTKGLTTLFVYLWLLGTVFLVGLKTARRTSGTHNLLVSGALAAILSYLIQNQFSFGVVAITSLFWALWGVVMSLSRAGENILPENKKLSWDDIPWLPLALIIAGATLLIYFSFIPFWGDRDFKTGKTYLEMKRAPEAVLNLNRSLEIDPFEGTVISHLGIAYLNQNNFSEAVKVLTYGTKVDPYNADNYLMLAKVALVQADQGIPGKSAEAMRLSKIGVALDPYYAEIFQLMGTIYERQGEKLKAARMYQKTFMINPNLGEAMLAMERVAAPDFIEKAFAQAFERYKDKSPVLEKLGGYYYNRGDLNKALNIARRMARIEPKGTFAYILAGQVYLRQNNLEQARKTFEQVVFLDPKNSTALQSLGMIYLKKGDVAKAKELFSQVLIVDPNNEQAKRIVGGR